ncbi:MAG: hypothetical protein DRO00_03775 [Thermoproteota archaeon]|nr:MAG: hypothetical protein DRO00_03775 [Candidatus Korarchaeota archaeon]
MFSTGFDYSLIKGNVIQRILAHLIDVVIVIALTIPFWVLFSFALPDALNLMASGSFFFIIYILYLSVMEGTRFTTIGKRRLGLYVLDLNLEPISLRQALIRNVVRVADSVFIYLPLLSRDGRRIGDGAAGTIVVSENAIRPKIPSPSMCRKILRAPSGVLTQEKATIKAFLLELEEESKEMDEGLFNKIRDSLSDKLKLDGESVDRLALDTFLLEEEKVNVALLALALLTGTVVFKEEKVIKVAKEIYRKASEICQEPSVRSIFQAKERALKSLILIKSGFHNKINLRGLLKVYSSVIPKQFRENLQYFLFSVVLFVSAILLGYLKLGWLADLFKEAIVPAGEEIEEISQLGLFLIIFLNNARVSIAMCGGGASVFITPVLLMINGIMVGSIGKAMEGLGKFLFYYSGITPHGLLELSAFFMSCASGFRAAKSILFPQHGMSRYKSLKEAFDKSFELGFGSIVFLGPAAAIESFITERLMGKPRYATYVGAGAASLLYVYLLLGGRSKESSC